MTSDEYQDVQAGGPPCERCGETDCICEREREKNRAVYEATARELGHTGGPAEVFAEGALWMEDQLRELLGTNAHELKTRAAAGSFVETEERAEREAEHAQLAVDLQSAHDRIAELETRIEAHAERAHAQATRPMPLRDYCDNPRCEKLLALDSSGRALCWWVPKRGLKFCSLACCAVHAEASP